MWLFAKYLKRFTFHFITENDEPTQSMSTDEKIPIALSQHYFGWPEHRGRFYMIATNDDTCHLDGQGLNTIQELYRKPNMSCKELFVAPKDIVKWRAQLMAYVETKERYTNIKQPIAKEAGTSCPEQQNTKPLVMLVRLFSKCHFRH